MPALPETLVLGLDAPACTLVAQELLRRGCVDPERPLLVVVPTKDAVRLLREQLALKAAEGRQDGAFICPHIVSASQLTGSSSPRAASPQLQQAALFSVLRREGRQRFPQLTPQAEQWGEADWLAKAGQFRRLYSTLSYEGVLPAGTAAPAARALAEEQPLWRELFELYSLYLEELHRHGLCDPAESTEAELAAGTRVILACVPSLSERARLLLRNAGLDIEVWLHTDELHVGPQWFDAWGRPGVNWLATPAEDVLGLDSPGWQSRFLVCGDLERMAEETALAAGRAGTLPAVGVCDPGMESAVAEAFARHGMATVRPRGIPFTASGWQRLLLVLTRMAELLELAGSRAAEAAALPAEGVAALLQNPIVTTALGLEGAARAALLADRLRAGSLPASFRQMRRLAKPPLAPVLDALADWLACLDSTPALLRGLRLLAGEQLVSGAPEPLREECALAAQFTAQVDEACRSLLESGWVHELSPLSTLHLLASAGAPAHGSHPAGALSLRGLLELPYAPEEQLVLAGLHDGIIPERWPASPYLTPQVIEKLGLPRDEALAARDAYLLRSLYRSRPGKVQALFSLLNARRDPLFPSSSFFRLTPQAHLAGLVAHFFDRSRPCPASTQAAYDSSGWHYRRLELPAPPDALPRLARLRLAELGLSNPMAGKSYSPSTLHKFLSCPLRFWLARLNGVSEEHISPMQRDLDAREIGNCLHKALEDFVCRYPSLHDFTAGHAQKDDESLLACVQEELEQAFTTAYERSHGKAELMPQQFQCAAMRRRLAACAKLHLQLWQQGWECARDAEGRPMVEYEVCWQLFGHPLCFRIDRIDRRRRADGSYEYRVIDYKTGSIDTCYKNHLEVLPKPSERPDLHLLDEGLEPAVGPGAGNSKHAELRWKDLQLPLYTAWAIDYFAGSPVNAAYILLSRKPQETRVAAWGDSDKDPDLFTPRLVPANKAYPEEVTAEPLFDNALRWIRFGLDALAEGRCLASAEMLGWKAPKAGQDAFGDILKLEPLTRAFLGYSSPATN